MGEQEHVLRRLSRPQGQVGQFQELLHVLRRGDLVEVTKTHGGKWGCP
jgi:hypothetical protein